ncbi:hypothetical protein QUF58_08250 [Anaerolineales bacterium HSG24]|nr:hypothetical protein [Anaerolineales bacterium HSG24]
MCRTTEACASKYGKSMRKTTIQQVEIELKKRVAEYPATPWGRKQNDDWDRLTNFVYNTPSWSAILNRVESLPETFHNYAINRWYNHWSARAIERIFCALPNIEAHLNQRNRLIDFYLNGIAFDHKTTVYPRGYGQPLTVAQQNQTALIQWLYHHQSRQQRYHEGNRLFLVLYATDQNHWQLKANLSEIKQIIHRYVELFQPDRLIHLKFEQNEAWSDLIWYIK